MESLAGYVIVGPDGSRYEITPKVQRTVAEVFGKLSGEEIGAKVRALRTERGIGQRELARRTSMTHAQISRIEQGLVKNPHRASLQNILAAIFG